MNERSQSQRRVVAEYGGRIWIGVVAMALALVGGVPAPAAELSLATAFAYQGRLQQDGAAAEGRFDLTFELYDERRGGTLLGRLDLFDQLIVRGVVAQELDFGLDPYSGGAAWLEILARPAGAESYVRLSPRQSLAAVAGTCVVNSDVEINGNLQVQLGKSITVGHAITGVRIDQNEIEVSALGDPQLLINAAGGSRQVGISVAAAEAPLHVVGFPDASLAAGGALVIGLIGGQNLALDRNEIMARDNGSVSPLTLNASGGPVHVGGPLVFGHEVIEQGGCSGGWITASCSAGKRVLGGGCYFPGSVAEQAFPSDGSFSSPGGSIAYTCFFPDCDGNSRAYAICANVQ